MTTKIRLFAGWLLLATSASMNAQLMYITNNGTLTITGYTGSGGALTIPSVINGLLVTSIGASAFNETTLTSVTIPDTVTQIGNNAFKLCFSLTNAIIPNSVTSIGGAAFEDCTALASLTLGDGVTNIGLNAFAYCSKLASIALPSGVTTIGKNAFQSCKSLTNVIIPDSVTAIAADVFQGCTRLASVTIGSGVVNIGSDAFSVCPSLCEITIPSGVTNIGDYAFGGCTSLTNVYCTGNAPTVSTPVFGGTSATVYYLPGTTGWGSTFGGVPAVLWQPKVQTGDASFGVGTNGFGFTVTWASGMTVVVEACTNLANPVWVPLGTNAFASDSSYFSDSQWTDYPARFYRLHSP